MTDQEIDSFLELYNTGINYVRLTTNNMQDEEKQKTMENDSFLQLVNSNMKILIGHAIFRWLCDNGHGDPDLWKES